MRYKRKQKRRSSQETEAILLEAATAVFTKKGYLDATVEDIILQAGVSRGAFYIYFRNKDHIFEHLVRIVVDELIQVSSGVRQPDLSVRDRLLIANRRYLEAFWKHRYLLRNLFAVAAFNSEVAQQHHKLREHFVMRIARSIHRGMAEGTCHAINPDISAWALGLMFESFAYRWLGTEELPNTPPFDFETVLHTLTDVWYRALYKDAR